VVNCFYLPGCIVGGLLMDRIGRKQTMTLGFFCWAIMGFIIGGALRPIQSVFPLFVVLYGIFNSFGESKSLHFFKTRVGVARGSFCLNHDRFPSLCRAENLQQNKHICL
jgi:MFS family permease